MGERFHLALAGRDEVRDLLDTLHIHQGILPLGPMVWAAVGKDPGYSPESLLELLRRRGKIRPEDLKRLDLKRLKSTWLDALQSTEAFVKGRPPEEIGCLYYDPILKQFVDPSMHAGKFVMHFGRPGGVIPRLME